MKRCGKQVKQGAVKFGRCNRPIKHNDLLGCRTMGKNPKRKVTSKAQAKAIARELLAA